MIKSVLIKESLPTDLVVKDGKFILLVKPADTITGVNSYFKVQKASVLSSVRGNVLFSTDNTNWASSVSVPDNTTTVYIKASAEDGIVFEEDGARLHNAEIGMNDTLMLMDTLNIANSNAEFNYGNNLGNARLNLVKGDVSVFKGKKLLKSVGLQCDSLQLFIFGDISGVLDGQNNCSFRSDYIFGDIADMLESHDYDNWGSKVIVIKGNDMSTFDKLYCSRLFTRTRAYTTDTVNIEQQMNESSIINILTSLASRANTNRTVSLNGPESAAVLSAITAFKNANGGTLTYNGTVR